MILQDQVHSRSISLLPHANRKFFTHVCCVTRSPNTSKSTHLHYASSLTSVMHLRPWTPTTALPPLFNTTLAIAYALSILAYPPKNRKLAFIILCLPVCHAFSRMLDLTPWFTVNDTFGRFLYIWLFHMSHTFLLLEFTPNITGKDDDDWRNILQQAYKVLFARHPSSFLPPSAVSKKSENKKRGRRRHGIGRRDFCLHHIVKAGLMIGIVWVWDTYIDPPTYTLSSFDFDRASFLRRIPQSLTYSEILTRLTMTWDICIGDMLYFESWHSLFGILFVGILRLDEAKEWELGLFGSLRDSWTGRRYWGMYWHDFIYESFSAHVKVLTRSWLKFKRGKAATRILENALVFVASGLMHSLVRWVQTGGQGEIWCVAIWYSAQIIPIMIEGVVQGIWARSALRVRLQRRLGERNTGRLDRAAGYMWVFGWMFWSVPKYLIVRSSWEMAGLKSKYSDFLLDVRS